MLLGLPVALFPALNAAHFGGSPRTLGLLNAAVGVGGLLSAVLSGPAARVRRQGRGMLAGTMIWGAAIAVFGVTGSLAVALLMLAVAGAADTLTVMFRSSMVQAVTRTNSAAASPAWSTSSAPAAPRWATSSPARSPR